MRPRTSFTNIITLAEGHKVKRLFKQKTIYLNIYQNYHISRRPLAKDYLNKKQIISIYIKIIT